MGDGGLVQDPWRTALGDLAKGVAAAACVGFFVNLLYLSLPLYQSQIFDRVISSGNLDTLVALTLIARPSLLVISLPAYLAGALVAGLTSGFVMPKRLTGATRPGWTLRAWAWLSSAILMNQVGIRMSSLGTTLRKTATATSISRRNAGMTPDWNS